MRSWYSIWLIFKELQQIFEKHHKRRPATSSHTNSVNKHFATRSIVQKRLSIYNLNPESGKEDAFEKQIAVKWHIITLQEASEYVDHDILTGRFHVTHCAGCAILFSKDSFYPNIDVESIYLYDTGRDLHCLYYEHGLNATSYIHDNSVPFLNVWNCHFQVMKSCPVTKNLTPQEQIYLVRGSR